MRAPLGNVDFGFDSEIGRPVVMGKEHAHHEMEFNFLFSGSLTYLAHGALTVISSRRLTLFWGAMPHQVLRASPDARLCWITVPMAWFLNWRLPRDFVRAILSGRFVQEDARHPADSAACDRWCADISSGSAELRQIALLELEARVRRMALHPVRNRLSRKTAPAALGRIETMARYIAKHYTKGVYLREIAASAGLNVNYASTLFQQTCGMSLHAYLTRHRIFHAQRLLATTERKVIDVAFESGFRSVSQFYVMFSRSCLESPRAYRMKFR